MDSEGEQQKKSWWKEFVCHSKYEFHQTDKIIAVRVRHPKKSGEDHAQWQIRLTPIYQKEHEMSKIPKYCLNSFINVTGYKGSTTIFHEILLSDWESFFFYFEHDLGQ